MINADEDPIEFEVRLPGGKTKKFRKWREPKTSKQKKDNDAFERARAAHERNTGKEFVEGSPRIARSIRSAYEQAAKEIQSRTDLDEEQKRQHLLALREQQEEAANPASKDTPALTPTQRHRRARRKRQRAKRKRLS